MNVDLVNDDEHTKFGIILSISSQENKFRHQSRAVTLLQICEKQRFTILMLILLMIMCIQNLVSICLFVLKILSKNQILTSIKGNNSVENLRKNNDLHYQRKSCQ